MMKLKFRERKTFPKGHPELGFELSCLTLESVPLITGPMACKSVPKGWRGRAPGSYANQATLLLLFYILRFNVELIEIRVHSHVLKTVWRACIGSVVSGQHLKQFYCTWNPEVPALCTWGPLNDWWKEKPYWLATKPKILCQWLWVRSTKACQTDHMTRQRVAQYKLTPIYLWHQFISHLVIQECPRTGDMGRYILLVGRPETVKTVGTHWRAHERSSGTNEGKAFFFFSP